MIKYKGALYTDVNSFLRTSSQGVPIDSLKGDSPEKVPDMIRFGGTLMIKVLPRQFERVATVINMSVWDLTLLDEARKWVATQLKKKRRVFQNSNEAFSFHLFSTNVPSTDKLRLLIPKHFHSLQKTPLSLREITNPARLDLDTIKEVQEPSVEVSAETEPNYDGDTFSPHRG
jgi:hypothetical protein